jgi:transcriptional regulator GlxA family with amidase domain
MFFLQSHVKEIMMHVSIVIPQGDALVSSILHVFNIFNWVNEHLAGNSGRPVFDLHLVGIEPRADLYGGIISVLPDLTLADAPSADLIIIPAVAGEISKGLKTNARLIPWMMDQYKMGAEIASLCTGAFFLAATGLMDGSKRTTHWFVAADCRNAFCQIKLGTERMTMKESRIHSRRGAYAFFNLLIEKCAGVEAAIECAKIFETDFNRECQSVVAICNRHKRYDHRGMEAAHELVDDDLRRKISRERFAGMFVLNRGNQKRRLENSTLSRVVRVSENGLEASYGKTEEARHEVCHNNSRAFRNIFNRMTEF